jgi:hypothetical protein
MGFDSPQDHELADAYREASEAMRAREGRTTHRSALPADDRLDDQAMTIHRPEMQVSMAKDMSTLTAKYYGCQDTDELLICIYANSLLAFSSRLLMLLTAPAFQLVAEALGHKYKESLAPTGDKHKLEHILRTIKDIPGQVTLSTVRALRATRIPQRRHMTTTEYKQEMQKRVAHTSALKKMTSEQHLLLWEASHMVESIGQDAPPHLLSLRQKLLATPFYSLSKSMMTDFWNRFEASTSLRINLCKGGGGAQGLGWGAQGLVQAAAQGSSHAAERRMPRQDSLQSSSHQEGSTKAYPRTHTPATDTGWGQGGITPHAPSAGPDIRQPTLQPQPPRPSPAAAPAPTHTQALL